MLGCGLDLVSPLLRRRTSVPCTFPIPALSDFITSTSDYLAPSLEHNINVLVNDMVVYLHVIVNDMRFPTMLFLIWSIDIFTTHGPLLVALLLVFRLL